MRSRWTRLILAALIGAVLALVVGCDDEEQEREGDDPGECSDDADNDSDGLFDCDDPDCAGASSCQGGDGDADADGDSDADGDADADGDSDGDGGDDGDLEIEYTVSSGTQNCEEVGIDRLEVYLIESGDTRPAPEDFDCTPGDQTILLTDVPAGSYTIEVEGLSSGNVIYAGSTSSEVNIEANQTNGPVDVTLIQLRPAIGLWFDFVDPGSCASFGVVDVVVRVYENSASIVTDQSIPCNEALGQDEPLLIENLSSTATYDLRVRGTNESGEYTFEYNHDAIEVEPGPAEEIIDVEMEQCSGLCSSP